MYDEDSELAATETGPTKKRRRRGMAKQVCQLSTDPPLCEEMLTEFSDDAVVTCLFLIDQVPDTVYRGTELLAILFRRNPDAWRVEMLAGIVKTLIDCAKQQRHAIANPENADEADLFHGTAASKFTVRLHIFSLFLEGQYSDIRTPAVLALKALELIPELVALLTHTEQLFARRSSAGGPTASTAAAAPKWLAQMILLIDLYEKVAVYTQRKNDMHRVTTRIWKWYDVASGKWNAYSVSNNKIINDAYWSGDASVRVSVGRHRYTINFNCMSQVNEETGNHRPVILGLKSAAAKDSPSLGMPSVTDENAAASSSASAADASAETMHPDWMFKIAGLADHDTGAIVATCVRLMRHLADRNTLHALMRFCVRLTTSYTNASVFAQSGGVRLLLQMRQTCGYIGFSTLANLLIRHTLEEPRTLRAAMQRVISARTMLNIPPGYRELVFMLRRMSSAVSRDPEMFGQVRSLFSLNTGRHQSAQKRVLHRAGTPHES